ncbi:MAG: 50S ribosomal protein L25/general stress protein Ctc [Gemmatimonadetes bacterium]|nr:50S ribosomal protein L25/general stress protein Ctc [Gemmatimonadota bacterium]MDE2676793.1 50S ribosomal protein L25/general stress protein Ctc [Gemmatimonadota bacterium]MXX35441.1 50S ribosomal protein L25/general stress protein Ctc [Gemmatimonadota bacterium]MYA12119.1 50S ribosomal protein L25/general stress protein Ctc [Gemmatimonadota bacterium]MYD12659.1 50S ribosomal protein L25/general stress protein Ctc [Gemmatimonadota bacterium]
METTLNLTTRHDSGKGVARKLRRAGRVPGVIYGGGEEPVLVSMEAQQALLLFHSISVENTILDLMVDDREAERALVREVQTHPYRTELLHVDFLRVQRGVAIELNIPVHVTGVPAGARDGGVLEHIGHDITVKCVPSRIPEAIEVDVSDMETGDVLRVGDLEMPEGVENLTDPERAVCAVSIPKGPELEEEEEVDEAAAEEGAPEEDAAGEETGGDED